MLKIRLSRGGTKKRPYYSIVIADSHSPRDGRFIEKVGTYNPLLKKDDPSRLVLRAERITEWLSKGAQPTDRVARFLGLHGLIKWEHGSNPKKGEPHAKAKERATERADKAVAHAEALAAAAAAPPPVVEEPVAEETPAAEEAPAEVETAAEPAAEVEVAAEPVAQAEPAAAEEAPVEG